MTETSSPGDESDRSIATDGERETLRLAVRRAYVTGPRETTLARLADELDRPDTRTTEDHRRGITTVRRRPDTLESTPAAVRTDGGSPAPDHHSRLDRAFDALGHPYRRRILLLVAEDNPRDEEEFAVDEIATEDDDHEHLRAELYHVHLPKLAGAGYIDWDEETQTVRRGPNFDEIAPLLRLIDDHRDELPDGWP